MGNFLRPNKNKLQNPQHFEFINAFLTVIGASGLSAAKVVALVEQLSTAFQEEDRLFMIARTSQLIAQRDAADRRRDNFYGRLHRLVLLWAGSGEPTKDPAATLLLESFKLYKVETAAQMERESGQLSNFITDLLAADKQAALTAIGGTYLFQQMKAAHEEVQSIRLAEGVEKSEKVYGALVNARKACDTLYDKLTYLIEAYTQTADDPAPYEAFVTRWNGTLKIYQEMLDRKSGTSSNSGSGSSSSGSGSGSNSGSGQQSGGQQSGDNGQQSGGQQSGGDNGGQQGGGTTPDPGTGGGGETPVNPDPGTGGGGGGADPNDPNNSED